MARPARLGLGTPRRRLGARGEAQLGGTRAGILRRFRLAGCDRLLAFERESGGQRCRLIGSMARRCLRPSRTGAKEALDDAVFERMERNHCEPAAGRKPALGRDEGRGELAELVVHRDAQGLERAGRRMDIARLARDDAGDHFGKRPGPGEGRRPPVMHDGTRDAARGPFLAKMKQDIGEFFLAGRVDDIRGGGAVVAHAHVERAILPERKAAVRRRRSASRKRRYRARCRRKR